MRELLGVPATRDLDEVSLGFVRDVLNGRTFVQGPNLGGGGASSVYTPDLEMDGGSAATVYTPDQYIDAGIGA